MSLSAIPGICAQIEEDMLELSQRIEDVVKQLETMTAELQEMETTVKILRGYEA